MDNIFDIDINVEFPIYKRENGTFIQILTYFPIKDTLLYKICYREEYDLKISVFSKNRGVQIFEPLDGAFKFEKLEFIEKINIEKYYQKYCQKITREHCDFKIGKIQHLYPKINVQEELNKIKEWENK